MLIFNEKIAKLCDGFRELASCKTKKTKEECMTKYSTDEEFCKVIEYLLNENKISGIRKSKLNKKIDGKKFKNIVVWNSVPEMLDYIIQHNTGTDIIVYCVQNFLKDITDKKDKQLIADIITKDFKCGVTDLTAYGFIPGLERNWRERKGHSLIDKKTGKINLSKILGKDIMITLKLDGYRYKMIKQNDQITFYTASGEKDPYLIELKEYAMNLSDGIYDGEIIAIGDFKDSTERFNATTKILRKKEEKRNVEFIVFDYIEPKDIDKFFNYEKITKGRYNRFLDLFDVGPMTKTSIIRPVTMYLKETVTKETEKNIINIYNMVINNGEEGLVIDIADAPYERKKGNSMFKLKPELSGDFKVVDTVEGKGKDKGRLGAFIIEYKDNTVHVGSGLTDAIREEVWKDKDKYINKLIEVVYFGETQDENGNYSLRLPRFKRFRHDKNDISYD